MSLSSPIHSSFAKDKFLMLSPHTVKPAKRSAVTGEREVRSGAPRFASPSSRVPGECIHQESHCTSAVEPLVCARQRGFGGAWEEGEIQRKENSLKRQPGVGKLIP